MSALAYSQDSPRLTRAPANPTRLKPSNPARDKKLQTFSKYLKKQFQED
jgi:hypothetical protein